MTPTDTSESARPDDESRVPRFSQSHAVAKLGGSPSAATVRTYIHQGLISPFTDSQGRFLFSERDITLIRQIHEARAKRGGRTVRCVTSTYMG
jgi:hypothetical protein